jgi:hypothetical protein
MFPVFYTPGWGALMTVGGTLGGVALTQWNANRQSAREFDDERRVEQREAVLDVLSATAELIPKLARFAKLLDDAKRGPVSDYNAYYGPAYKSAVEQSNVLTRVYRKAELIVTDKKISAALDGLRDTAKILAQTRSSSGKAAEAGQPDSQPLRAAIAAHEASGTRLKSVTRQRLNR